MKLAIIMCSFLITAFIHAQTVSVGSQTWMTKNLESSTFQNGTAIIHAQSAEAWQQATESGQPAWAWYYDQSLGQQYGYLYNIHAMTKGNPCPTGFRVPTNEDWEVLFEELGTTSALAMKSTEGWETYNGKGNGTNSSGLNIPHGGIRSGYGGFNSYKKAAYLWSNTSHPEHGLWSVVLNWHNDEAILNPSGMKGGLNCRCIKE